MGSSLVELQRGILCRFRPELVPASIQAANTREPPRPQASLRGAARCHGDFIATLNCVLHYPIVLLRSGGGALHGDSHGRAEVTEVVARPERIAVSTNTPHTRPRLVGEVDDTPPEHGHGVRLATKGVVRDVARCSIDSIEHLVVAVYDGGVRAAQVEM